MDALVNDKQTQHRHRKLNKKLFSLKQTDVINDPQP